MLEKEPSRGPSIDDQPPVMRPSMMRAAKTREILRIMPASI
jgi:hypothetical protein